MQTCYLKSNVALPVLVTALITGRELETNAMMEDEEGKKRGVVKFEMMTDDKADITATPVILQIRNLSLSTLLIL